MVGNDPAIELSAVLNDNAIVRREWPDEVDFDVFQAGCTNNRSTVDVRLLFDELALEHVAAPSPP